MASTVASAVRPLLRESRLPSSPHTPTRFLSSTFSSPGSTFRQEEDAVIVELGSRFLRAGFEGEAGPQCVIPFGPEESRRVGDFRGWAVRQKPRNEDVQAVAEQYEFWRMDLNGFDHGLMEDKLERTLRDVYNKYLLTDAGTARLVLVVPSILPHPLISPILSKLFARWKFPTITLLPSPAMSTVAAGLRSALVVDVGWHETIVSAVYEHREIKSLRTTRAMRSLTIATGKMLTDAKEAGKFGLSASTEMTFDFTEELISRLMYCKGENDDPSSNVDVDWPTPRSSKPVRISRGMMVELAESVFFDSTTSLQRLDDHEWTLPLLVYRALLALSSDARSICMSRIVFVGGGANIPGLAARVLDEVRLLVENYGWSPVRGKPVEGDREKLRELRQGRSAPPSARHGVPEPAGKDYVEEAVRKQAAKNVQPMVQGELRQVESLGAWAGASLLASLKVRGVVEVERERYLAHGLNGAQRDVEVSMAPQRLSFGPGVLSKAGDRSSWTLAGWG